MDQIQKILRSADPNSCSYLVEIADYLSLSGANTDEFYKNSIGWIRNNYYKEWLSLKNRRGTKWLRRRIQLRH